MEKHDLIKDIGMKSTICRTDLSVMEVSLRAMMSITAPDEPCWLSFHRMHKKTTDRADSYNRAIAGKYQQIWFEHLRKQ